MPQIHPQNHVMAFQTFFAAKNKHVLIKNKKILLIPWENLLKSRNILLYTGKNIQTLENEQKCWNLISETPKTSLWCLRQQL